MNIDFPKIEEEILKFWEEKKIFQKSLLKRKRGPHFIFYEGPPYANGLPGIHHLLARAFKDIILRFKTMCGFFVQRRAGWDTHGLPTEIKAEEVFGIKSKKEIEKIGTEKFIEECKKNVFLYKKEWEEFTKRIGFWLDLENAYVTCHNYYIETLWYILKEIYKKGLLYKDLKVAPYCPRCGTTLSSHEVAQGYKKIKEPAIYVKFKLKNNSDTFLLVWTTTPWTLPGNSFIALNPQFDYVILKFQNSDEKIILAKNRIKAVLEDGQGYKILKELKGKELLGKEYEPLFQKNFDPHFYKILPAEFVSLQEGTGLVHIAPAFGEEDLELLRQQPFWQDVKEKIPLTVDEEGRMDTPSFSWHKLFVKDADQFIIQDLQKRNLLFKVEQYSHDYPFCWRCHTPLIYYLQNSWFIKITALKEKLIENNQKINWIPSYIKNGRFGQWLQEIKDWNLSRSRFWGTPLPVWNCKNCGHQEVIGSRADILAQKFSTNKYFLMRHGESLRNINNLYCSWPEKFRCPLTEKGKSQVRNSAKKLKNQKIDLIFSSDLLRCRQTAEIVAKELGLRVIYEKRLRELDMGVFNGKSWKEAFKFWDPQGNLSEKELNLKRFKIPAPKGESYTDCLKRMLNFIKDIEKKYQNKKILIISHELPLLCLEGTMKGMDFEEMIELRRRKKLKTAEFRQIDFKIFPYNKEGELDLHRPYVDQIEFFCPKCQKLMRREEAVIDVWFDSGAMPFASWYWPFKKKTIPFPADFICEGVDQTRGWFYTLLAISTLLGFGPPYKNVISLGLVVDKYGRKMSKSKGNIILPSQIYERFGVDCARLYFYSLNPAGERKRADFDQIKKLYQKFFITLFNALSFFNIYRPQKLKYQKNYQKINILDKWIFSKINHLKKEVKDSLEKLDIVKASRFLINFVEELSNWYIRRSRQRFQKPKNREELKKASACLWQILIDLSKISAPFIPFFSEKIYQDLKTKDMPQSVHLCDWPEENKKLIDQKLENDMQIIRECVGLGLKIRKIYNIKIRQPLSEARIVIKGISSLRKELLDLLKEELNIKKITIAKNLPAKKEWAKESQKNIKFAINLKITKELKKEGYLREIVRHIQELRKKAGFLPKDQIAVWFEGAGDIYDILRKEKKTVLFQIKAKDIFFKKKKLKFSKEIEIENKKYFLGIEKV